MTTLDRAARALYDASPSVKPTWDQLGDVTRSVWREYAERKAAGIKDWWAVGHNAILSRVAGALRRIHSRRTSMELNNAQVAETLDEIAALFSKLSGTFRAAGDGGDGEGNERPAAGRGKPAAKSTGKTKPAAKEEAATELTEDDVREALKELVAEKGKDTMIKALESVGASKLAEVDESQYQELMGKVAELKAEEDPAPTPAKAKGKPAKAKKGPTLEELTEAAKALIDADKPAYLKIVKKFGKPSEVDADQYAPMLEAIQAAMPDDSDEGLL